jgi:hypothetical protein
VIPHIGYLPRAEFGRKTPAIEPVAPDVLRFFKISFGGRFVLRLPAYLSAA